MSGYGANVRNRKMIGGANMLMRISGVIIMIGAVVMLYYLYQWLYSATGPNSVVPIIKGTLASDVDNSKLDTGENKPATPATYNKRVNIKGLESAGQYSVSMWVYVKDTKGFLASGGSSPLANLLEISDDRFNATTSKRGDTLIFVGLNPVNAGLIVRQSTTSGDPAIRNSTSSDLNDLINNYSSKYASNDRCDIVNGIEYQRWVLVTAVANSRTLDVYLDGKLARSCVYSSPYGLRSAMGIADVYIGANNGTRLKGYFATTNLYNYALTPDAVWAIYQTGPSGPFDLRRWLWNFISVSPARPTASN